MHASVPSDHEGEGGSGMKALKSADQTYEVIRQQIFDGTLEPGRRLVEADLALDIKVSRTPVREALQRLGADGLVELLPHRGARVREWTVDDLREIYELRAALEPLAADRAASRITPADCDRLAALCDEMEACLDDSGPASRDRYSGLNTAFHELIWKASGSDRLTGMIQSVVQLPLVVATFHRYSVWHMGRSCQHHREMTEAFRAGDGAWAGAVMRAHVLAASSALLRLPHPG